MEPMVPLLQVFLQPFVYFAFGGKMEQSAVLALVYIYRAPTSSVVVVIPKVDKHILCHLLVEVCAFR